MGLRRLVEYLLVKPEVQWRVLDLELQAEQYEVFHRDWRSRIPHYLFITPNVFAWFLLAAALPTRGPTLVLGGSLLLWYALMDVAVALVLAPLILLLVLGASAAHALLGAATWHWALGLMVACSFAQTVSHAWEPIPPPWSGSHQWVPLGAWWRRSSWPLRAAIIASFPTVFVLLEWISSPRLLPVQAMHLLGALGLRRDFHERVRRRVPAILADYRNG